MNFYIALMKLCIFCVIYVIGSSQYEDIKIISILTGICSQIRLRISENECRSSDSNLHQLGSTYSEEVANITSRNTKNTVFLLIRI